MEISIREYKEEDISQMMDIWNTVVTEANAFPQVDKLTREEAKIFFQEQTYTGVAAMGNEILGLYILHPNNIGRCGHIANASYAVKTEKRGLKVGEKLVRDSLYKGKELGFLLMQFNAVVSTNKSAIHLYEKIGFVRLGIIPEGFLLGDGTYTDIILYYIKL
ncbi:GNAT family N-acetyltransferase [Mobilitalea sibirica]|uniref:GNAT family N-acetyltransferase n=1 Tax=Mobilitalea sibirica TaxID=1462919 RepID=A0A8J7HCC1_9FIRM|nr:GNAT family N-acetyltransferase [Mobilitalea sibirica]MBH1940822.1 GNAT family N-acetyltransferase [Mobilitalea sibirica]